jgi:hypothetical protein
MKTGIPMPLARYLEPLPLVWRPQPDQTPTEIPLVWRPQAELHARGHAKFPEK